MIRAFCLLLLLANVGYFAWHAWIVPPPAASPPPPRAVAPLLLAREAPTLAVLPEPTVAASESTRCISIGPFVDITEAAKAGAALRAKGYAPRQRALEGVVWSGYWVALDQDPAAGNADAILTRLRKSGIADSYMMPAGEGAGAKISLGLFTDRRRALTRVDEVRALGLEPAINVRQRMGTVYWVDLDVEGDPRGVDFDRFEGEAGRILRLEIKPCDPAPDVATDRVTSATAQ